MTKTKTTPDYEQFINSRVKEILGDEWHMFSPQEKVIACVQAAREWQEARSKGLNESLSTFFHKGKHGLKGATEAGPCCLQTGGGLRKI